MVHAVGDVQTGSAESQYRLSHTLEHQDKYIGFSAPCQATLPGVSHSSHSFRETNGNRSVEKNAHTRAMRLWYYAGWGAFWARSQHALPAAAIFLNMPQVTESPSHRVVTTQQCARIIVALALLVCVSIGRQDAHTFAHDGMHSRCLLGSLTLLTLGVPS